MARRFLPHFYLLLGALLLLWPALFNGYSILNNDDGTYLSSGFIPDTPADRPITYGLLLRITSLNGWSLWGMVILQSGMMSWLVQLTVRTFTGAGPLSGLLTVAILALLSPLAYCCSLLLPDVFTGAALLCAALLLAGRLKRGTTVGLYLLYTLCIATHLSHVLLFCLLLLLVFLLKGWLLPKAQFPGRSGRIALLAVLSLLCVLVMGSAISKSKHVFIAGGMADRGVLKPYLQAHCPADSFRLCPYADALPEDNDAFIWDTAGPLYRSGGWEANKKDLNRVIRGSLTEPRFLALQVKTSLQATGRQLLRFETGEGAVAFDSGSSLYGRIRMYVPGDTARVLAARQQRGMLLPVLTGFNKVYPFIMAACCVLLLFFLRRRFSAALRFLLVFFLAGLLLNAWDCATLSGVMGRYGGKVAWLLPLWIAVSLFHAKMQRSKGPHLASLSGEL